jgi:8-oxo-dGTP pyrophosphatase MutT (NUDIX family)
MAEANEAPHEAAARELREELGLDVRLRRLLCVGWVGPHDPWDDLLMFVFDDGQLDPDVAEGLSPVDEELRELGWFTQVRAAERLRGDIWGLTRHALRARDDQAKVYLDQGQPPFR